MTLHNALSVATPSQRLAAARHNERLSRINGAAIDRRAAEVAKVDEAQVEILEDDWAARQLALNPLPKPWFSIEREIGPPRIGEIIRAVCKHFDVSKTALFSARRDRPIVRPRQIAYYLCKTLTLASLPEIGRRLGDRDHTSVLAGVRRVAQLIESDQKIAVAVADITAAVKR